MHEEAKGLPIGEGVAQGARSKVPADDAPRILEDVLLGRAKLVNFMPQDERPGEAEDQLRVAFDEVLAADVDEVDG